MLSENDRPPALTDARGVGGVIAQDGFDYQVWDGLARLPAWLANPAFEEMIFEGLEDLEARFFAPQAPRHRLLERYQAKAGGLAPAEVRGVLESFQHFESSFPHAARVQTLVTPRLPPTLAWLARDPLRVRRARPFYAPFLDIREASDKALHDDLVGTFGDDLGAFVAGSVEISERSLPNRDTALAQFGVELDRAFPSLETPSGRVAATFEALTGLAHRLRGAPMRRAELIQTVEVALGRPLPLPVSFPLHIRSDRNDVEERALEIDASAFSGGAVGFPVPTVWADGLLAPLDRTARWLRAHSKSRIALSGSYRLTTAMAVGWSLRAATGFELEISTRAGTWRTDDRPIPSEDATLWEIQEPARLKGDRLIVAIGVLRDAATDVVGSGAAQDAVLRLHLPAPISSGQEAQAGVAVVKRAVNTVAARLGAQAIDLYLAGPAAFAVVLGHRWNAMAPTQLYEFAAADRHYVQSALL